MTLVPLPIEIVHQSRILLFAGFDLKAIDFSIIGSANQLDPIALWPLPSRIIRRKLQQMTSSIGVS